MHIGMKVRHPDLGVGTVKGVSEHLADIRFDSGLRSMAPEQSNLEPAEALAEVSGLAVPLTTLVAETVSATIKELGLERDDTLVSQMAARWEKGAMVMRPSDPSLQSKEVPLESFFHKIVMMRNNLRVLEQKINSHPQLSDAEKVELQQYISRCYGSMTTFNLLFKQDTDHFKSNL
jgi:hypothetical protein